MLTDSKLRSLKPSDRYRRYADGGGLYIEVRPSGTKAFKLAYRFGGKQRTETLGDFPILRLGEARAIRETAKLALKRGRDPFPQRAARETVQPAAEKRREDPLAYARLARDYVILRQKEIVSREMV